jgi:CHAT domain-containing protein/tetratricopeptide (TPR) repeat protein
MGERARTIVGSGPRGVRAWGLALFVAAAGSGGQTLPPSPPPPAAIASEEPRALAAGGEVQREIAGGRIHPYLIRLESGQLFHATLIQQGADVALVLARADGTRLREADFSEGPEGREALSLIAESSGELRLEVRARAGAAAGRYALTAAAPRMPSPVDRDRVAATELLSEGVRLHREGRAESYRPAIEAFAKARPIWRGLGDRFFEALCLHREAASRMRVGEYHHARELFTEALGMWRAERERLPEARTLDGIGSSYFYVDEYEKALDYYLQALSIRRAAGDRDGEAASLNNVGIGHASLGQFRASLSRQEEALAVHRALGDRRGEATLLHNMAVVYFRTSRIQKALDRLHEALALSRELEDRRQEAGTLGTLALVYSTLGNPQDALLHYRQGLDLWRLTGHRSGEATTLTEIGRVHASLGETDLALRHYRRALELHRAMGDRAESGTLLSMGMAYKDLGDLGKAAETLEEGLRLSQQTRAVSREGSLLSGLGQVYAAQGDAEKAVAHLERALSLRRRLNDRAEEAAVLHELARVELGLGQVARARERLEAALGLIASVRDEVASHELRAALGARSGQVHELYLDVLMQEHARAPEAGFETRAFEASESSRVQGLLELLAESHLDLREGADPALLERERALQEEVRFKLDRQLRLLTGAHTEEQAAAADAEVRTVRSAYGQLQGQIRAASPRYAALRQPQVLTLKDVQERVLDPGSLLLEYALGDDRSFLFAVTSGSLRSYTLPGRAEVEAAARRAHALLSHRSRTARPGGGPGTGSEAELAGALRDLSRMLLEPVRGEMAGKRLLVVPDGAVQYVPFGVLPIPGRPTLPLVAEHEVVAVPSASLLSALRTEAAGRKPAPRTLAVIADPVFDTGDERVRSAPAPPRAGRPATVRPQPPPGAASRAAAQGGLELDVLPRLPFTRREARAILSLAPPREARAALDFDASLDTVLRGELIDYRFLHFATHGFLNNSQPELSGLVLSLVDRQGNPQEGFLSAGEVFNLKLSAELVVLSGCRTALGRQMKGEGVIGLTRAFMYAGTPRVLASLWSVDDAATAELMSRLYEGILVGRLPPARALQRAQWAMARQKRWRQPYYWAGFQLQGDWN